MHRTRPCACACVLLRGSAALRLIQCSHHGGRDLDRTCHRIRGKHTPLMDCGTMPIPHVAYNTCKMHFSHWERFPFAMYAAVAATAAVCSCITMYAYSWHSFPMFIPISSTNNKWSFSIIGMVCYLAHVRDIRRVPALAFVCVYSYMRLDEG